MARQPVANHSAEARALRGAAIAFARQVPDVPIDGYDTLGIRANAKLLRVALAYAKRVSHDS